MKSSNIRTFPMFNVPLVTIPIFKRPIIPPRHQMNPYQRFSPYPQPIATKPQLNPQSMYPQPIAPKTQQNLQPMYPQPIAPKTQLNFQQKYPPKTQQKFPMNIEPIPQQKYLQKIQLNPHQKNPSKNQQIPQQKYLPKPQLNSQQKQLPKTQPKRAGIRGGPGMDSQQQQYCLKWNSFGSNLATSFANLWNSESLADVTLYCEGRTFKAHKVILAACSKHFQELFDTAPPSHAGACYVILEATSADNMQALLEFMYKGEVHVSQDALSSFLKSGENLQVKGLSMEMSNDAWVKQQTQQSNDRHPTRIKTSPVSGSGNCEAQEATSHTATFAPIIPTYGIHGIHGSGSMGRYVPPAHVPLHPTAHRRPAQPKPSPSQSPHPRNYRQSSSSSHCGSVAEEPDTRSSPGAGQRFEDNNPDCTSTLGNPVKNNGYERSGSATDDMIERLPNDQGAEDLRVKSENDYHQSGYNNSPPPAAIPTTNYHEKPLATSPVPPKPTPDIWPTKIITSKSGGIATADGKKLKCPYCERLYGYETNLRAHIRQRHQGIRVPCPHCSRTFTRNNTVRRHIAREHRHQVTPHTPHTPHAHAAHATHAPLHAAQPPLSNHTQ